MFFAPNAIFFIKLLIPTLHVAEALNWNTHELSKRVEQLEKLDEAKLLAVVGMYAKKQRCKLWHDQHVKSNRFRKGDLVMHILFKSTNVN